MQLCWQSKLFASQSPFAAGGNQKKRLSVRTMGFDQNRWNCSISRAYNNVIVQTTIHHCTLCMCMRHIWNRKTARLKATISARSALAVHKSQPITAIKFRGFHFSARGGCAISDIFSPPPLSCRPDHSRSLNWNRSYTQLMSKYLRLTYLGKITGEIKDGSCFNSANASWCLLPVYMHQLCPLLPKRN